MPKSESITIRVSPEEKKRITEMAGQSGLSTTDYIRATLESRDVNPDGKLAQSMVCYLCELENLMNCVEDKSLQKRFADLEKKIWPFIK